MSAPHVPVLLTFAVLSCLALDGLAQSPDVYSQLRYRHIGPVGNRVSAVAGVPGDRHTYYAGAASGGVWKTVDGGINWEPVFDDQAAQSIGALAVAPSDSNVVWAGSGEACIRSHISIGNGIYKSTDSGRTWTHMGLDQTGRIGAIAIDPRDPRTVFVAAQGHSYGPQEERGVYRTRDGGGTWERVLFANEDTGAIDVVMDPNNPRILFAGMWQLEIHTWGRTSGGPGSGIFTSRNGGDTWTRLQGHGLPTRPVGKIALGIAQTNSDRIYALIETGDGVPWPDGEPTDSGDLWRSDDGGESWQLVSHDRNLGGRQPYYTHLAVSPDDEDEVYFLAASMSKTLNGGTNTDTVGSSPGGDNHDMWIDPTDGDRMIVGNDGAASISTNRGRSWNRIQLPIAQMYHVTVDNRIPYYVYGNRQDGPSTRGPSNSRMGGRGGRGGGIPRGEWHSVGGGESGWATPDPVDANIIWSSASGSGSVGGIAVRYDERTRHARNVEVWPLSTVGHPAEDLRYRFVWTYPLTISPHDHNKVYVGSQHVHVTTDGGDSWQVISPDLTLNDKSRQHISGGLTPDNIGVEYGSVLFAIAESPIQEGLIWAGSNDGLVHVTRDGGETWTNVTENVPDLPTWGTISNIEPSRYDVGTAYFTVDGHQANNRDPHIYKTTDFGRSWRKIVNGIPKGPMSYTHVVREDPVRRGLLYAGTENALYVSFDDGDRWQPLQTNLPHAPVYWLVIQEHFNDLVVGTYGRGFWIMDDITPLQQLTPEVLAADVHLFAQRPAYRFHNITSPMRGSIDPSDGQNPDYGASINYYLKSAPDTDVTIEILDSQGETVRELTGTKQAGINRLMWDLRNEPTEQPRLRTSPTHAPEVRVGPEGWRAAPGFGGVSVLMPPGTYEIKLTVGERVRTQLLEVRKDSNSVGTEASILAQTELLFHLQADLNAVVEMVNLIEVVRSQLQSVASLLGENAETEELKTSAEALEQEFINVEEELHQLWLTGRGQDAVRYPIRLGGQLGYLARGIASADFGPTTQQREVHDLLEGRIDTQQALLDELLRTQLQAFNAMLQQSGVGPVVW